MNKVEILEKFREFNKPFYTFPDLQLMLGLEKMSANKRIIDMVNQGFLRKLGRNIFVPGFKEYDLLEIASQLNQPSYLSFESALQEEGLLEKEPNVKIITLASFIPFSKRIIDETTIMWSKISEELFWGFRKKKNLMIAYPEKALLDISYLASFGRTKLFLDGINLTKFNSSRAMVYFDRLPEQTKKFIKQQPRLSKIFY